MTGEPIYSVEVAIVRGPGDPTRGAPAEWPTTVRYCDVCQRWGAIGTTHMCWRNWHKRLSDLLVELTREGRR